VTFQAKAFQIYRLSSNISRQTEFLKSLSPQQTRKMSLNKVRRVFICAPNIEAFHWAELLKERQREWRAVGGNIPALSMI